MSEPTRPAESATDGRTGEAADTVQLVARLIDEVRADARWREAIAAQRSAARTEDTGVADLDLRPLDVPRIELVPPEPDPVLWRTLDSAEESIEAADHVVPISPGIPFVGETWAAVRKQIHAEIRIYQDRQTLVNARLLGALHAVARAVDPTSRVSAVGALWAALQEVERQAEAFAHSVQSQQQLLERQRAAIQEELRAVRAELREVRRHNETIALELEPLGHLRAHVGEPADRT